MTGYPYLDGHWHMYQFIVGNQPNLMFIHFDSIDDAGHTYQWGTKEYYDAVKVCLLSTHIRILTVSCGYRFHRESRTFTTH